MADQDSIAGRDIVTRAQAKQSGALRYFTGGACKHGHVAERLTINGACVECSRLARLARYRDDPAADLARQKIYREAHPERNAQRLEKRHAADPELAQRAARLDHELRLRADAESAGLSMYDSTRSCAKCETARRFVHDGKCVECNRLVCLARYAKRVQSDNPERIAKLARAKAVAQQRRAEVAAISAAAQIIRDARQGALARGEKFYVGRPCPLGHEGVRYANFGTCKACAAEQAASPEKKAYDREYLKRNLVRVSAQRRVYRERNAEMYLLRAREWAKANPDKRRAISAAYTARRRAIEKGGDSTATIFRWEQAAPKVCHWCSVKCPEKYHVDHYEPLSKGGRHEVDNLVIACPKCNLKKSAKDPYVFAAQVGRLF